ncbi:MAG: cytochrome bc complex cytochrome b subunit [Chloroflexota bacterium]
MSVQAQRESRLSERVPVDVNLLRHLLQEPIPVHLHRWWFALGSTPLLLFLIQVGTGILLTFYYVASPERALDSVRTISEQIPFGWWFRGVHHWGASLMILTVVLHMVRVFFTTAYRRPRELNWLFGTGLLFLTLAFGFTGYALVYNQLSYWATTVGTNLIAGLPLIGNYLLAFTRGGLEVTANTLTRFFTLHIGLLPTFMIVLLGLHILLIRLHGVAQLDPKDERTTPFFPDHVLLSLLIGFYLALILSALAVLFPPPIGDLANPAETPLHIKPEWYFYGVYRWLRLVPGTVGLAGMFAFAAALVFWPVIDSHLERWFKQRDVGLILGAIVAVVVAAATIWEAVVP